MLCTRASIYLDHFFLMQICIRWKRAFNLLSAWCSASGRSVLSVHIRFSKYSGSLKFNLFTKHWVCMMSHHCLMKTCWLSKTLSLSVLFYGWQIDIVFLSKGPVLFALNPLSNNSWGSWIWMTMDMLGSIYRYRWCPSKDKHGSYCSRFVDNRLDTVCR